VDIDLCQSCLSLKTALTIAGVFLRGVHNLAIPSYPDRPHSGLHTSLLPSTYLETIICQSYGTHFEAFRYSNHDSCDLS
jgi:hypothetical protein